MPIYKISCHAKRLKNLTRGSRTWSVWFHVILFLFAPCASFLAPLLKHIEHIFIVKELISSEFCFQKVFYEVCLPSWCSDKRFQRFWEELRKSGPWVRQKCTNCRTNDFRPSCFQWIANQINKYISMFSFKSFHKEYVNWSNLRTRAIFDSCL